MYPRILYEITPDDLKKLLDAMKPVPMIMLHLGRPRSQQENANAAWAELGARMGFDAMTVQPAPGRGDLFFTAVPSETPEQRDRRLTQEVADRRAKSIAKLRLDIAAMQQTLAEELAECEEEHEEEQLP